MEGHYGNAMTEIALALAMAFFSVMVLAMVSMGAGSPAATTAAASAETLHVTPSRPSSASQAVANDTRIVVFWQGRYLSDQLKPVTPDAISSDEKIILAIDPALPMAAAMDARSALETTNITVTVLDQRWMRALEETSK